ncbi:hypothetical protein MMC14_004145 [Varicellaria rhodocarpa]|nr:hypothetical protein [Varicellaria rhodocarpa]
MSLLSPQGNSYANKDRFLVVSNATSIATSLDMFKKTTVTGIPRSDDRTTLMHIRREHDALVRTENIEQFRSTFRNAPKFDALPKADFVDVLEKMGYGSKYGDGQAWGFVIFRTVYGDESKWTWFQRYFNDMVESQFEQAAREHDESSLDKFGPRWRVMWVEDERRLNNATIEEVRRWFDVMLEKAQQDESGEGILLDQLKTNEVLMVDSASLSSVIRNPLNTAFPRVQGEEEHGIGENHIVDDGNTPFVTIVETSYTPEDSESWSKGYLKVAIAGLMNEIWLNLAGDLTSMEE